MVGSIGLKLKFPTLKVRMKVGIICINKLFLFNILLALFERSHSVIVIFVRP